MTREEIIDEQAAQPASPVKVWDAEGYDALMQDMEMVKQARHQLVTAKATYIDYVTLCTARHRCQAANDMGLVRPAGDLLQIAYDVLNTLGQDCHRPQIDPQHWTPRALRASELASIDDMLAVYRTVVQVCTYGEWRRIEELSLRRVRSEGGALIHTSEAA